MAPHVRTKPTGAQSNQDLHPPQKAKEEKTSRRRRRRCEILPRGRRRLSLESGFRWDWIWQTDDLGWRKASEKKDGKQTGSR